MPRARSTSTEPTPKSASGPQRALEKLGLRRPIDHALHLPIRYEDETRLTPIATLRDGQTAQVEGRVRQVEIRHGGRRQLIVHLTDPSGGGELLLRFLHFYPSQPKSWAAGKRLRVRGEVRGGFFGLEMVHPTVKVVEAGTPLPSALTPVYPTSAQLPQAYLRKAIEANLARADLDELLPDDAVPPGLVPLREALAGLHRPPPGVSLEALEDRSSPGWQRLKYEELLAQQLSQLEAQQERAGQRAPRFPVRRGGLHERLLARLPFALTEAQRRVAEEIAADLQRSASPAEPDASVPMHRLLQGDVGSGKTIVAALAATLAIDAGWQCALMAPTEILAAQHWDKLAGWLEPLGVTIAWLTGSRQGKARAAALGQVASGAAQLVIGTHAVIEEPVAFARLGLAIVDEQHRFGVAQRLALRRKLGAAAPTTSDRTDPAPRTPARPLEPHTLMMSATPIPRTLAMTLFADLDVSTIDALPPGRQPIVTRLFADERRDAVIARIRDAVEAGEQVYWVCPLIDEIEEPPPDTDAPGGRRAAAPLDLRNATETHAELSAALAGAWFAPVDAATSPAGDAPTDASLVGLLHGRLPAAEKARTMAAFAAGALRVLVATTVIEVGVDVPNASLMVIEHAERFGLSQLHQLRGRVGRGTRASACVLLYATPLSPTAKDRLRAMRETGDGFEIARRDLEIRGPGEFLGARQSGAALLRFADPLQDEALLRFARELAPRLRARDPRAAARHVERWLGGRFDYLKA